MDYLADTVAIVRHLRSQRIGPEATRLLREADAGLNHIYLSGITLMEVLYLSEARRIEVPLNELLQLVTRSRNYEIVPVDANVVQAAVGIDDVPELHDRIIAATAKYLHVPLLTSDQVMTTSRHVQVIW